MFSKLVFLVTQQLHSSPQVNTANGVNASDSSPAGTGALPAIAKLLRSELIPSCGDPLSKFLPVGYLESILTQDVIESALQEEFGSKSVELSTKIRNSYKPTLKIFATLILIEEACFISQFIHHGVSDDHLPLSLDDARFQNWHWSEHQIERFCNSQYAITAPVFDFTKVRHFEMDRSSRMPFLEPLEWKARGTHGEIAKVKIHPHHELWEEDSTSGLKISYFAVKRFTTKDATEFEAEKAALLQLSGPSNEHRNLIKLLQSYRLGDEYYMIFHWAQGNLAEFWKNHRNEPESRKDWIWLTQQCLGMSDGLSKVHGHNRPSRGTGNPSGAIEENVRDQGRHGDIKPENILFFEDTESSKWYFVIADFTLMRFHTYGTINKTLASRIDFTRMYCPPEVELDPKVKVGQSFDVWALGCVYLEIVTWYLLGYDAVRSDSFETPPGYKHMSFMSGKPKEDGYPLRAGDRFFSLSSWRSKPRVNRSIKKRIRILHNNEHCSNAMHDFLALIVNHMLVPSPKKRYSMDKVREELQRIAQNCEDEEYCYTGNPQGFLKRWISDLML